mgnify:CR=1 FL=1|jgi:hypothetical protein
MHKEYCEYKGSGKIARSCFSCFSCFGDRHVARDSDASGQHSAKSSNCQTAKLPTWENILRHFWLKNLYISDQTANFQYVQIIVVLRNGRRRHTRGSVRKKKRPRKDIHLPRGLLIASHSTINPSNPLEPTAYVIPSSFVSNSYGVQHSHLPGHTPDSTSPPARRRVALQKRCIPRNVALKRETPELIPSMALKSSFLLLLDSHEA